VERESEKKVGRTEKKLFRWERINLMVRRFGGIIMLLFKLKKTKRKRRRRRRTRRHCRQEWVAC
jgi:hypothetical protein